MKWAEAFYSRSHGALSWNTNVYAIVYLYVNYKSENYLMASDDLLRSHLTRATMAQDLTFYQILPSKTK